MLVIQLLLLIYSCLFVYCEDIFSPDIGGVSLDISENSKNVAVEEGTLYGIAYKSFLLGGNQFFSLVTEAGIAVWTNDEEDSDVPPRFKSTTVNHYSREGHSPLLTVYKRNKGLSCFAKDDGSWKRIEEEDFDARYAEMRHAKGSPAGSFKSPVLNILAPDDRLVYTNEDILDGTLRKSFFPKGHPFSRVTAHGTTIWNGFGEETCSMAFYSQNGQEDTLVLQVAPKGQKSELKHFKRTEFGWLNDPTEGRMSDHSAHNDHHNDHSIETHSGHQLTPCTLDLARMNPEDIFVDREMVYGIDDILYLPRNGRAIVTIVDNGETVWKAEGGQRCTAAFSNNKDGTSLLELHVKSGSKYEFKHFWRVDQRWKNITREEYNVLYEAMLDERMDDQNGQAEAGMDGSPSSLKSPLWSPFSPPWNDHYGHSLEPVSPPSLEKDTHSGDKLEEPIGTIPETTPAGSEPILRTSSKLYTLARKALHYVSASLSTNDDIPLLGAPAVSRESGKLNDVLHASSSTSPFTLDVLDPDSTRVFAIDTVHGDLVNWKFAAYVNNTIAKVVSGSTTLWEAERGSKGTLVDLLYKGREPILFSVLPDQNDESTGSFFERRNGIWIPVGTDYFRKKVVRAYTSEGTPKMMPEWRSTGAMNDDSVGMNGQNGPLDAPYGHHFGHLANASVTFITLDISDTSNDHILEYDSFEGEVTHITFISRKYHDITRVMDGYFTIWEGIGSSKCLVAELSSKPGHSPLLFLFNHNTFSHEPLFYEKKNGQEWKGITKEEFDEKLKSMEGNLHAGMSGDRQGAMDDSDQNGSVWNGEMDAHNGHHDSPFGHRSSIGAILNLANPDELVFVVLEHSYGRVSYFSFTARDGYNISAIYNGTAPLWEADKGERCVALLAYVVDDGSEGRMDDQDVHTHHSGDILAMLVMDGSPNKCYERSGSLWKEVEGDNFTKRAVALMAAAGATDLSNLDLEHPNKDTATLREGIEDGVHCKVYSVHENVKVTTVVDGSTEIWEGDDKDYCVFAQLYFTDSDRLLYMEIQNGGGEYEYQYFERKNDDSERSEGREDALHNGHSGHNDVHPDHSGHHGHRSTLWVSITWTQFEEKLRRMRPAGVTSSFSRRHSPSSSTKGVTLDLFSPDMSTVSLREYTYGGVTFVSYSPRNGRAIVTIMDNGETLWKAKPDEKCKIITLSSGQDYMVLILDVHADSYSKPLCFKKDNGTWKRSDEAPVTQKRKLLCLDLSLTEGQDRVTIYETNNLGLRYKRFSPNDTVKVDSVTDSGHPIWVAPSGYECTVVEKFSNWTASLLYISFFNSLNVKHKCFSKVGDEWVGITEEEFEGMIKVMKGLPENYMTMDITKDGSTDSKVIVQEDEHRGVHRTNFYPVLGSHVFSVVDSEVNIWTANNYRDKCTLLELYTRDYTSMLMMHMLQNGQRTFRYFIKGVNWNEISRDAFFYRLNEMMNNGQDDHKIALPDTILDIANESSEGNILYYAEDINGVSYKSFFLKNDAKVTEVVDLFVDLWKASGKEQCTAVELYAKNGLSILTIYYRDGNDYRCAYYSKRHGEEWMASTEEEHRAEYKRMMTIHATGGRNGDRREHNANSGHNDHSILTHSGHHPDHYSGAIRLDLADVDSSTTLVIMKVYDGYTCGTYSPKNGMVIHSILDNGMVIWKGGKDEKCTFITVYHGAGSTIAHLVVRRNECSLSLRFEKNGNNWVQIPDALFFGTLRRILRTGKFALDLASPNPKKVEVYDHDISGVKHRTFFPSRALELSTIVHNGKVLWTARHGEKCTAATMSSKNDTRLLLLHVQNGDLFDFLYYESGWERSDQNDAHNDHYDDYSSHSGHHACPFWRAISRDAFYAALKRLIEAKEERTPSLHVALNLNKLSNVHVKTADAYGVGMTSIKPKKGVVITSVSSSKTMLWRGKPGDKCKYISVYKHSNYSLLYMLLRKSGTLRTVYFIKNANKWVKIHKKFFYRRLHEVVRMHELNVMSANGMASGASNDDHRDSLFRSINEHSMEESRAIPEFRGSLLHSSPARPSSMNSPFPVEAIVIDLSNPDTSKVRLFEDDQGGVHELDYYPNDGFYITKVMDNNVQVWKRTGEQTSPYVETHAGDGLKLMTVHILDGNKFRVSYYAKKDGHWNEIDAQEFSRMYNGMRVDDRRSLDHTSHSGHHNGHSSHNVHKTPIPVTILDITSPDVAVATWDEMMLNDIRNVTYTIKDGQSIVTIMDGDATMWNAKEGEECTSVNLSSKGNSSIAFVDVKRGNNYTFLYFFKDGTTWKEASQREYDRRLSEMMNWRKSGPSPVPSGMALPSSSPTHSSTTIHSGLTTLSDWEEDVPMNAQKNDDHSGHSMDHHSGHPGDHEDWVNTWKSLEETRMGHYNGDHDDDQHTIRTTHSGHSGHHLATPITLDISSPDRLNISVDREEESGVRQVLYQPKDGTDLVFIVDSGVEVWQARDEEECISATLLTNDHFALLHLYTVKRGISDFVHFSKTGGLWRRIYEFEFDEILARMKKPVSACTLDLMRPDPSKLEEMSFTDGDLAMKIYKPKNGDFITGVVDGLSTLWRTKSSAKCTQVNSYTSGNESIVVLCISSPKYFKFACFEAVGDSWIGITEKEFSDKLYAMKKLP